MNKRKYYRKCGICGEKHEQSEMIRDGKSPTGYICMECEEHMNKDYGIYPWE